MTFTLLLKEKNQTRIKCKNLFFAADLCFLSDLSPGGFLLAPFPLVPEFLPLAF